ncbi:MAG TPA: ATP-binding protein [Ktedonobacteraceae bacterium]|nr:ATP-binding protein [Ktedonobacteraceae bacterium]
MAKTTEPRRKQSFPRELLEQPKEERLAYFKAYTVAHPHLSQADDAVWNAIREPAGKLLIFVFGPTGVGKTTLLEHVEKRIIEKAWARMAQDQGHLPVVRLNAMAPSARQFKWPDFYTRALKVVFEPLPNYKIDYRTLTPLWDDKLKRYVTPRSGGDAAALQRSWEQMLKYRQPSAILIDEAQHFGKLAKGSSLSEQLDHIKSLAVETQTVHVLAGTYDLPLFRTLNAQLSRRSIDVHFPRYDATKKEERLAFQKILLSFQRHLPLVEQPDLIHQWKYCYARSVGCVGILKDWLTKALDEALENGEKTLSSDLLARHALSADRCDQMISDVVEGEKRMAADPNADEHLLFRLGLSGHQRLKKASQGDNATETRQSTPKLHDARVGQRNPERDPVKQETGTDG